MKKLIALLLILSMIFTTLGCENKDNEKNKSEKRELVILSWGGKSEEAFRKVVYEPFEEKFNCKITTVSPVDYSKIQAAVELGSVEWDLVDANTYIAIKFAEQELLEKLDYSVISGTEGIDTDRIRPYSIGAYYYTPCCLVYNTNIFKDNPPAEWKDLWNVKDFPGVRMMPNNRPQGLFEVALLADGVAPEDLYPLDIDRAFQSLDKIKEHVNVWFSGAAQVYQGLCDETVEIGALLYGNALFAKQDGAPISIVKKQRMICSCDWCIPKGAPHKDLAMEFINFAISPEVQAEVAKIYPCSPTNMNAYNYLTPEEADDHVGNSQEANEEIFVDEAYWTEHYDEINARFQEWINN